MSVLVVAVAIAAIVFFIDQIFPESRFRPVVITDRARDKSRLARLSDERR